MVNNHNKILILDIETRPAQAYVWRAYGEQNIGVEQIINPGGTICIGAKWLGDKETYLYSDWEHGHKEMLYHIHLMMEEADAVVTYNGDKFDLPKLQGEFLLHGFGPTLLMLSRLYASLAFLLIALLSLVLSLVLVQRSSTKALTCGLR
jgi:DNA polymerase elongation subunit (family B)